MKMIRSLQLILQLWLISAFYCSAFLQNNKNYNGILHKARHLQSFGLSFPSLNAPPSTSFLTLNAQSNENEGAPLEDESENESDSDDNSDAQNPAPIVTQEMFLRDMLKDPPEVSVQKKRKKGKGKEYRVFDNRDSLPFAVQGLTPDPYTHPDVKEKLAKSNSKAPKRRNDSIEQIASSVYTKKGDKKSKTEKGSSDDEDYTTKLGEFALDKHTTTGDVLNVGDTQYKVVRLKCQYKYSGGGRFVMVRKILQVKEVGRLETEESLARQWKQQSSGRDDDVPADQASKD
jgi:hypothetical protein